MKPRQIYFSKKRGKIVCEVKIKGRTTHLFTFPDVEKMLLSDIFTEEKKQEIRDKINRADFKKVKKLGRPRKVRTTIIK